MPDPTSHKRIVPNPNSKPSTSNSVDSKVTTIASENQNATSATEITVSAIVDRINDNELKGLSDYDIRQLVKDAKYLGEKLKADGLKTNQVRKFLDAINRIKAETLDQDQKFLDAINRIKAETLDQDQKFLDAINRIKAEALDKDPDQFEIIKIPIVLLKPKLAYAAARQKEAKSLQSVLDAAIDRVHSVKDFNRLVQLVESIIAYHKAAGGE